MTKLLYIPTSTYIYFKAGRRRGCPSLITIDWNGAGSHINYDGNISSFIEDIVEGNALHTDFYKRNNLELPLSIEEFEIIYD